MVHADAWFFGGTFLTLCELSLLLIAAILYRSFVFFLFFFVLFSFTFLKIFLFFLFCFIFWFVSRLLHVGKRGVVGTQYQFRIFLFRILIFQLIVRCVNFVMVVVYDQLDVENLAGFYFTFS